MSGLKARDDCMYDIGFQNQIGERLDRERAHAAICRALERGPAFRARCWAYPSFLGVAAAAVGAVGTGRDGDDAGARDDLTAGGDISLTSRLRVYRSKSGNIFARLLGR